MKIIVNKFIPFHGYIAMAFFNMIIWRSEYKYKLDCYQSKYIINHESIHEAQMRDFCKWIPIGGLLFYICYLGEWIFNLLFRYPFSHKAYSNLSYEREAKLNEKNLDYLKTRKKWSEFKYLKG